MTKSGAGEGIRTFDPNLGNFQRPVLPITIEYNKPINSLYLGETTFASALCVTLEYGAICLPDAYPHGIGRLGKQEIRMAKLTRADFDRCESNGDSLRA